PADSKHLVVVALRLRLRHISRASSTDRRGTPWRSAAGSAIRRPLKVYPRLSPQEQRDLLRDVVARCRHPATAPTPAVVFDLDGTLMDNRPRTCAILHEFAAHLQAAGREPEIAARLRDVKASELAYLLTDSLELLGIRRTDLVADASAFWRER